jgi:hypothetical protein
MNKHRLIAILVAAFLLVGLMPAAHAAPAMNFVVLSPYEDVDWETFGQHKAALHVHTNHSDGSASLPDTVRHHYNLGYDILAITDHDVLLSSWDERAGISLRHRFINPGNWFSRREVLTNDEIDAIYAGTYAGPFPAPFTSPRRTQPNGMIGLPNTNEHSRVHHINTFWAPFNNARRDSTESVLYTAAQLGGVAIINHPGRYTGGQHGGARGEAASNNIDNISQYVNWFGGFDAALGMEIFNRLDNESRSDRILWDNLLMHLMPFGRPVWGFSNDDSHIRKTKLEFQWKQARFTV